MTGVHVLLGHTLRRLSGGNEALAQGLGTVIPQFLVGQYVASVCALAVKHEGGAVLAFLPLVG